MALLTFFLNLIKLCGLDFYLTCDWASHADLLLVVVVVVCLFVVVAVVVVVAAAAAVVVVVFFKIRIVEVVL
jgi:hypothetical protein